MARTRRSSHTCESEGPLAGTTASPVRLDQPLRPARRRSVEPAAVDLGLSSAGPRPRRQLRRTLGDDVVEDGQGAGTPPTLTARFAGAETTATAYDATIAVGPAHVMVAANYFVE